MGWQDDLAALLQETGGNVAGSAVGQAVGNVAGPVLGSGLVQDAFNFGDIPRQTVVGLAGEGYALAHGQGTIPWGQAQANTGARISAINQEDWGPLGFAKKPVEVLANLATDPVNLLGFGAGTAASEGARVTAGLAREAGRPILASGLEAGGRAAQASQFLWNDAGQMALEGGRVPAAITRNGQDVLRLPLAGREIGIQPAVRFAAGKLPQRALETAPKFVLQQKEDAVSHALDAMQNASGITPAQRPVSSIFDTAAPPQAPHPHPPGSAPAQAYQGGIRGWLQLHSPRLGIVPQVQGQDYWRDPSEVVLQPHHIEAMADIGVATMQQVTDEGGIFPSLIRGTHGTQLMRDDIVRQFGPGIEPMIPAIETRMREKMLEQGLNPDLMMPASRQFLPNGWAKGVMSTRRLEAANALLKKGGTTREEALAGMINYPKSPQVVEAAAAQGAGFLSLFHQAQPEAYKEFQKGGVYFPQGLHGSRSNARVIIPDQFAENVWHGGGPLNMDLSKAHELLGVTQPFGSHREAWNTYMRQQFPGIKDDELNTLADMSTDMLYHTYINAASPTSSGGVRGAEKVYRASIEGQGVFQGKAKKLADTAKKISRTKQGQVGGMLPNLQELATIYNEGLNLHSMAGPIKEYFPRAAEEATRIVGAGNYEDLSVLLHAIALTSTATDVENAVPKALRILAEWKFKNDATLQATVGITGSDFDKVMKDGLLHADFRGQQKRAADIAINQFANLREGQQAITSSVHGGAKVHSYAGSLLAPVWRKSIDTALEGSPLHEQVRKAFDKALSVFAWDRHHNRIDQGANGVNAIEAFLNKERGLLTARHMGISPEEAQSGGWYWARNAQGLLSEVRADGDTAMALRNAIQKTWNHDPDTKETWDEVIARLGQEKGLTPEQAVDETYDVVRQDVFYKLLKSSLSKPEVQLALEKAGVTPTLTSMKDDVLGIIQRGAHGLAPDEWPQPLSNVVGPGGLAEQAFASPPGTVLQYSDGSWKPRADGGFGVPIALGKAYEPGQVQTARKSLEGLLTRGAVSDLFDPSSGVDNTARLGIGVVQDGNELRPAVVALTTDQARASAGAARTDARRVINLDTGEHIPVPGTTRNRHLPGLLEDISGPGAPLVRPGLEEARKRGVTMMEADTANIHSILQRKIINPLMDAYATKSLEDGGKQLTGKAVGPVTNPTFPEKMVGAAPSWDWKISDNNNAVLSEKMADGRSIKDTFQREKMDATQAIATLKGSGVTWDAGSTLDERLKLVEGNPTLTKIIKDWHKKGVDPLYAGSPETAAKQAVFTQLRKESGLQIERQSLGGLFKAAWGELALFSPKFLFGNLQGAWIQNALAGVMPNLNWKDYYQAYKIARGGLEDTTRADALASLKASQIGAKYGVTPPQEILRGGGLGMMSNASRSSSSAVGELVGRVTRNQGLGRKIGTPFVVNRDLSQAIETVVRGSVWGQALEDVMPGMIRDWEQEIRQAGKNIPGFEFSVEDGINVPSGGLTTEALRQNFLDLGLSQGQAEHLTRGYANIQGKGQASAIKEMQRVQFSYDRTNLDEWISKVVPFHYWYSRALRYYGEEAIRHPFLALNYMRATDGIDAAQNDPGLSARQKGFLRLMGTAMGFTLLMNPDALFGVTKVFNLDTSYEPDGQTSLGGAVSWLKDRGFGVYPWIDGTLNLMGLYGNTFEPDLLGIRHKALVGAAANWVGAHTGFKPGAPYADAMGQVRYAVSSFVSSFTPDWVSQPVPPRVGGSSQEASLDTIIEAQVVANNPGLSNGDLLTIMADPDSPQYKQAYQQAADAGIVQQLLNFIIPENFRMRSDKKDQLAAEIGTIYDAAQAQGVSPYNFAPTQGDLAFKAKYKSLTGHEWTPGSYEDAKSKYDLIRAPNEAKPFIVDSQEYQHLGTPKQQRKFDTYWALRNGTDPRTTGLPDGSRKEIALQWADAHHAQGAINDTYALRDAFEASHPEFQEFKDWQNRVSALANLYGGNLAEYRRRASQQNPNAARYFADSETFVKQTFPQDQWAAELDRATTSAAAFNAITGKGTNRMSPGPFPGVPPVDVTLPSMEPPSPPASAGPYAQDWVKALNSPSSLPSPVTFG